MWREIEAMGGTGASGLESEEVNVGNKERNHPVP